MKLKDVSAHIGAVTTRGALALSMAALATTPVAIAQMGNTPASSAASGADAQQAASIPVEKLVTLTCRQAWQAGGRNQDGFFAIVEKLSELAARNREVTLPNDQAAGAKAGQWIRTQALKDPDQLLYAVVDHAVQYSIAKGRTTPAGTASQDAPPTQ